MEIKCICTTQLWLLSCVPTTWCSCKKANIIPKCRRRSVRCNYSAHLAAGEDSAGILPSALGTTLPEEIRKNWEKSNENSRWFRRHGLGDKWWSFLPSQRKVESLKLQQRFAQDLRFLIGFLIAVWGERRFQAEVRWWRRSHSLTAEQLNPSWGNFQPAFEKIVIGVSLSKYTGPKFLQSRVCFLSHPGAIVSTGLATTVPASESETLSTFPLGMGLSRCYPWSILSFFSPNILYFLNAFLMLSDSTTAFLSSMFFKLFCLLWVCQPCCWPFLAVQTLATTALSCGASAKDVGVGSQKLFAH